MAISKRISTTVSYPSLPQATLPPVRAAADYLEHDAINPSFGLWVADMTPGTRLQVRSVSNGEGKWVDLPGNPADGRDEDYSMVLTEKQLADLGADIQAGDVIEVRQRKGERVSDPSAVQINVRDGNCSTDRNSPGSWTDGDGVDNTYHMKPRTGPSTPSGHCYTPTTNPSTPSTVNLNGIWHMPLRRDDRVLTFRPQNLDLAVAGGEFKLDMPAIADVSKRAFEPGTFVYLHLVPGEKSGGGSVEMDGSLSITAPMPFQPPAGQSTMGYVEVSATHHTHEDDGKRDNRFYVFDTQHPKAGKLLAGNTWDVEVHPENIDFSTVGGKLVARDALPPGTRIRVRDLVGDNHRELAASLDGDIVIPLDGQAAGTYDIEFVHPRFAGCYLGKATLDFDASNNSVDVKEHI